MSITITTTIGPNANSFVDLPFYKGYISEKIPVPSYGKIKGDEFLALVSGSSIDEVLKKSLIAGTRALCGGLVWSGSTEIGSDQSLCFPRKGLKNRNGVEISSTEYPLEIKQAGCEMALYYLNSDVFTENKAQNLGIKGVKAGSVAVDFQSKEINASSSDLDYALRSSDLLYGKIPASVLILIPSSWYVQESPSVKIAQSGRVPFLIGV